MADQVRHFQVLPLALQQFISFTSFQILFFNYCNYFKKVISVLHLKDQFLFQLEI